MRQRRSSLFLEAFFFVELVFHTIVREIREESGNAALGIVFALARIMLLVMIFYLMLQVIGFRSMMIRGDAMLFIVAGVMLFFMHNRAVAATLSSGSSTSAMMLHAPMTPPLMITASALAVLYLHVVAAFLILTGLYVFQGELEMFSWKIFCLAFLLAWASGVVIGLLFLMIKPFAPNLTPILSTVYQRANMITSGKFFVANLLPTSVLPFFDWNPLFHSIDQARGGAFVNYVPRNTTLEYPVMFIVIGLVVGMMGEFWLRKTVSRSTAARS